jgi:hypothetical protein
MGAMETVKWATIISLLKYINNNIKEIKMPNVQYI